MKIPITALAVVLFIGLLSSQKQESVSTENQTEKRFFCPAPPIFSESIKMSKDDGKIDRNWYQKAIENIEKEEYSISYSEELRAYQSPNRANNIRFIYHKDGFTAKTRDKKIPLFDVNDKTIEEKDKKYEEIDEWSVKLKIENEKLEIEGSEIKAAGNKAWIENDKIRIDYTNARDGMRQDFIIKNRPESAGILRLNLSADTKLKIMVGADALIFKDRNGEDKMKYSSLKCWDATGRELRAYFEKDNYELESLEKFRNTNFAIPNSFFIIVNDEDAVYPVTIDPLSTSPDWTADGNQTDALFGFSVSTAGDVNGDGYSDVIVGAYRYNVVYADDGRAFVYYGSASGLSVTPNWTAESNQEYSFFGYSVSTAGDVNGDGYSAVIVGAYRYENGSGQTDEGRAFVYHGSASGLSLSADWTAESNQANANFGRSVSTAGDVNADGYSDIIIGAYNFTNGQASEGKAYVFRGSSIGVTSSAPWEIESNQANTFFGWSVSSAGDVNGDGYSDVIVGARNFDNGQDDEGIVYVYHGMASSPGVSASHSFVTESDQANAFMGWSVSSAGDVNGDGYSDVLVGLRNFDNGQTDEGQVRLYYGSQSGITETGFWSAESNFVNSYFGQSVSSAGDVNGDGYSDVIIGAHLYSSQGRVFAYYGNEKTGKNASVQQKIPNTNTVVSSGGLTGFNGQVKLSIFGRSPFGKSTGRFIYEYKVNGTAFSSGSGKVTNSVSFTGAGNYTNLGTGGILLSKNISGLQTNKEYKWRARIQYELASNPYQKFGPWKYYSNYMPAPYGGFKPKRDITLPNSVDLYMKVFIQGFYDAASNLTVKDTLRVYLREGNIPYAIIDSAKSVMYSDGNCTFIFENASNNTPYYIEVTHRNSIKTWSKTAQQFTGYYLFYDFSSSNTSAYGDNQIQVDASPVLFAIYGGDVNQDGTVDATDVSTIDNDASNFVSGYVVTDLTGDDFVDGTDFAIADNNAANFVGAITP